MLTLRKSQERGYADHGWLKSFHSFSFANYYDPEHMGFGNLRVINEDRIAPGTGFGRHGHRDMEIISYVLAGELAHQDTLGNVKGIPPGDVQRMSAGTGVQHSEFNPSPRTPVHFLQIWIEPAARGMVPSYEQKFFAPEDKRGQLRLLASHDGRAGSVTVHRNVDLYASLLAPGEEVSHSLAGDCMAYLHLVRGAVRVNGVQLETGDGAKIEAEQKLTIAADTDSEVLLFDLD